MRRYDRYGDPIEPEHIPPHEARCKNGWLGEDAEGRPIPCTRCRPHLTKRVTIR